MNVLLYVTTVLMMLSLMTYAALESFKNKTAMHAQFMHYSKNIARKAINSGSAEIYDLVKVNKGGKREGQEAVKASSRISLHILCSQDAKAKNPEVFSETVLLLKALLTHLYGKQEFFLEAEEKHPNFLDSLLKDLIAALDALPQGKKIKRAKDLANLDITGKDQALEKPLYLILKGVFPQNQEGASDAKQKESADSEAASALEAKDGKSESGFASLLDYVTLRPVTQIRVFLASKELLKAIYADDAIVSDILSMRKNLYKEVSKSKEKDEAKSRCSAVFENAFKNIGGAPHYEHLLNFSVTDTNPSKYDGY